MSYKAVFHPLVQNDFNEAYKWYEEKQAGLGERFLKALREKIEEIVVQPESFGSRSNKKFREAQVNTFPFLIVYKIVKKSGIIYVASVHHYKKHPKSKYRKM
jgi:plasmid stabilization system protein ParE